MGSFRVYILSTSEVYIRAIWGQEFCFVTVRRRGYLRYGGVHEHLPPN